MPKKNSPAMLIGKGSIQFYNNVNLGYWPSPFFFSSYIHIEARNESAKIIIGNNVFINNNTVIVCDKTTIKIGNNVLVGTSVEIYDSDFHSINPTERNSDKHICSSVTLEDNVFVGSNSKILKGVSIGENSIVANSSVVTKSFPGNVIIGGNPAKVISVIA